MALNQSDRDTLLQKLYPRVTVAVRQYFLYVVGTGNAEQVSYCKNNMKNIPTIASEVLPWLDSEPDFLNNGTSISDAGGLASQFFKQ